MDDEEIEEYDPYEKADYERDKQRDDDMLHALEYKNLYNRAVTRLNEVKKENEELKAELKRIKCCSTCNHFDSFNFECRLHGKCKNHNLWEMNR